MEQRDAEPAARGAQRVAAVGRAVVQVEGVWFSVDAYRAHEQSEHVVLALGGVGLEGDEVTRVIVDQAVDPDRRALSAERERRAVTHVALPERVGQRGLPAQPGLGAFAVTQRDPIESLLAQKLAHGAGGDLSALDAPVGFERAQDERDRRLGVLAANVAEQGAKLGAEIAPAASVGAGCGAQAVHASQAKRVVPALERGDRVAARTVRLRRPMPLLGKRTERDGELAAGQIARQQGADDRVSKVGHGLAVVPGMETSHE